MPQLFLIDDSEIAAEGVVKPEESLGCWLALSDSGLREGQGLF